MNFVYLAGGKLHLKFADTPVQAVESRFAQTVRQRAIEMERRNAWKMQGHGGQFRSGALLWGLRPHDPATMRIAIGGLTSNPAGELVYSLQTPDISGIFVVTDEGRHEQRLFHTADFRIGSISASRDRIAFTVEPGGGTSAIAVMDRDGGGFAEVTQGDSVDEAPSWVAGSAAELLFQSAGIGRNAAGAAVSHAPFAIHRLNVETGELSTLLEESDADLLSPRLAGDGSLYYIRRPYRDPHARVSAGRITLDFVLLPFRLLFALFQYLNFFTARYAGKTLTTTGEAAQRGDERQMMIWGNLIDASKAAGDGDRSEESLVPSDWCLVRRLPDGTITTIARGVLSFDLCGDGSLIYTNGSAILHVGPEGTKSRLAKDSMIQQVIAVPES